MTRLSKSDKYAVAAHNKWREWGLKFGWKLYGTNGSRSARFTMYSGEHIEITDEAKQDIDTAIRNRP